MSINLIEAQNESWSNFCKYHVGDWHGNWTTFSSEGQLTNSIQCIRSFRLNEDGTEIQHHNHYTYEDGKKESKLYGNYNKSTLRSLFLKNCFSWGLKQVDSGTKFFFETGFRYEQRRISVVGIYKNGISIDSVLVISEHIADFPDKPTSTVKQITGINWNGISKTITDDYQVSSSEEKIWTALESLGIDYFTMHFSDGISISCPQVIEKGQHFLTVIDWQVLPTFWQRGIRKYDQSGFSSLTLEEFHKPQ
ncbi:DUF3598 family protein [Calothrix sp. PCC 6303]|uniref:DUF3598 family protein n=1 Tax=Calothrix sp. PCC 6303 TaxID=1170562 RepID=UPI0002A055FE|nr:DUF3598 family protein [Calothrix sp. PCC 6303]AFZ00418.1 hypothetical protein Cal6303_1361 [Calothrix sp. PCC 6303]